MTREQRARRYLQASVKAGYTGLPAEHREAYQAQMREHQRAYPGVREHALAGADQDFDKPLQAGEREHQQHLRGRERLQHADVLRIRRELREGTRPASTSRRAPARPRRSRTALATPQAAAQAAVDPLKAAVSGKGSLWLQIAGYTLGLSLVYLLVSGKHIPEALKGISNVVVGAAKTFIAPIDPITSFEHAIKAKAPLNPASEAAALASAAGAANIGEQLAGGLAGIGGKVPPSPAEVGAAARGSRAGDAFARSLRNYQQAHHIGAPSTAGSYGTAAELAAHGGTP